MKKKILMAMLILGMSFSFAACGSADDAGAGLEISDVAENDGEDGNEEPVAGGAADEDGEEESAEEESSAEAVTEKKGSEDKSLRKPYLGIWKYETKEEKITFEADFTWSLYSADGERVNSGKYTLDEDGAYLYDKNDEFFLYLQSISMNNLADAAGNNLFRYIAD